MLGKLIKYEFKATWMVMTLACAVLIGSGLFVGLIGKFISLSDSNLSTMQELLIIFGIGSYIILLSSMVALSTVYLIVHYYKSLYTPQGYLSFTLPASITEVVSSRIIVGCIWASAAAISAGLSITAAAVLSQDAREVLEFLGDMYSTIIDEIGMADANFIIFEIILYLIISSIQKIMMYDYCVTVGQLWSKHKIIGAVLCYFATSFILGIISVIGQYGLMFTSSMFDPTYENAFTSIITRSMIYSIVLCAIFYFVAIFVSNKKLNLD